MGRRAPSGLCLLWLSLACSSDLHGVATQASRDLSKSGDSEVPAARDRALPSATTSYTLFARLDEKTHTIFGQGTIDFINRSPHPTSELYFHLYLNAFENEQTLFLRKRGGRSGSWRGRRGFSKVESLRSESFGDAELWDLAEPHSPGDPDDRTDIRVALPRAILAQERVVFEISFVSQLPEIIERTGYRKDFHFAGQWFPKLAKREANGKWAHFAFHPFGEFYADFGNYDISLDVPSSYGLGSTGQFVSVEEQGERRVYRALATGVHDFAWTAWPGFDEEERRVGGIVVRVLAPKGSPRLKELTFSVAEAGLSDLESAYGPYPYPQLTIVQPPHYAKRAGGMEYPGLITTRGTELSTRLPVRDHELVTIHEMAHLWFHGMIASNEMASPFLDEGLASFAEWRFLEKHFYPGSLVNIPGLSISRTALGRFDHMNSGWDQAIALSAPQFASFGALGSLVYSRAALCLLTLERVYEKGKLDQALQSYAKKWRFGHPQPRDFFKELERVLGPQARSTAELMFQRQGSIDLQVDPPETVAVNGRFHTKLTIRKSGTLKLPFDVAVEFGDGVRIKKQFKGNKKLESVEFDHFAPIQQVIADPEQRILIDESFLNNRYLAEARKERTQQAHSALSLTSWLLLLGGL